MSTVLGCLRTAVVKIATPVIVALGFLAFATVGANAVTINFSSGSLSGANGFTVTGYTLTSGNCPSTPECSTLPNAPNVVEITAVGGGTFDLLSFMYQFQGTEGNGDLKVISNLSTAVAGIIAIANPGNPQVAHTYNVVAPFLEYFTGVSSIKFFTDTRANVRIDDVEVFSTVPLPAGIALGASGLGLLGVMGWRRKKALAA